MRPALSATATAIVLAILLAALPSEAGRFRPPSNACEEACLDGLEADLLLCEDPAADPEPCVQGALEPFGACFLPCVQAGWLSIYRLQGERHLLVVRGSVWPPAQPESLVPGGTHLGTVPLLEGVRLRGGFFPSFSALSDHVMSAYQRASAGQGGCTSSGGCTFNGPPRIFILLPSSGPSFMPLGIGGTNFDRGTVPYVNSIPSISLFNFSTRNLPLIGSISVGFTIVPPAAPSGPGDVMVEYNGQQSNRFPFTKN
jgi:hypothetical protein